MCGRFAQWSPPEVVAREFSVEVPGITPRYNVAPTQAVGAVRASAGGAREYATLRWGLVPAWAKDPAIGHKLINARSETVAEKPSYRDSFLRRRCLIPADGFFEWQRRGGRKQPYYFQMKDGRPFAFAGLWDRWARGGEVIESCTILTAAANEVLRPVHDRMPVILSAADYDLWLDPGVRRPDLLAPLLRPYAPGEMESRPVSPLVNSPANDDERCVASITEGA